MKRFIAIGLGGMAVLMFSGSQVVFFSSVDTELIQQSDFIADWFVYRVMVYSAILLIWPVSVRFITSDEIVSGKTEATERKKRDERRKKDQRFLISQWWKIALLLAVFEVLIVRQMGILTWSQITF